MTRSTKRLTDAPPISPAAPEHVSATISEIEQATPTPPPAPQRALAPKTVKPLHQVVDGRGAMVWRKTGDHTTETVWDPNARPADVISLPLGADLQGICLMLARKHNLDKAAFLNFCHANTSLVRACGRRYTTGQQLNEFDELLAAFKASQPS